MGKLNRRKFCKCGCGTVISATAIWVKCHHRRGISKVVPNHHLCACGLCDKLVASDKRYYYQHGTTKFLKPIPNHHPCICGCGELVASNKKFVRGHNNKGTHFTEEHKQNLRKPQSEQSIRNMKEAQNRPEVRKANSKRSKEYQNRSGVKEENSRLVKLAWQKPETKAKRKATDSKSEVKERRSKALKITSALPAVKAKHITSGKKNWQSPIFVKNQMKARHVKQNKTEKRLEDITTNLFPYEYKFVGDGEVVIAGKCPDFININGQKKIIELFGDYWHKGQNPQDRIDVFFPYGYDTLIIWEKELKDVEILKIKLNEFHIRENPYTFHGVNNVHQNF